MVPAGTVTRTFVNTKNTYISCLWLTFELTGWLLNLEQQPFIINYELPDQIPVAIMTTHQCTNRHSFSTLSLDRAGEGASSNSIHSNVRFYPLNKVQPCTMFATSPSITPTPAFLTSTQIQTLSNNGIPFIAGTLAFAAMLSLSTLIQLKIFRISTGSLPPLPSMIGFGTVATATAISHIASIKAFQLVRSERPIHINNLYDTATKPFFDFQITKDNAAHLIRVSAIGLLTYKGLGGRFWSISPSNLTNLGSFARTTFSIPATDKYATQAQRKAIERLGRTFGCHTCGSRRIISRSKNGVKFIADHMPPQSAVKQMNERWYRQVFGMKVKQRFYPQCVSCSNLQGGILSEATRQLRY